jgi:hypothetical protein
MSASGMFMYYDNIWSNNIPLASHVLTAIVVHLYEYLQSISSKVLVRCPPRLSLSKKALSSTTANEQQVAYTNRNQLCL